MTVRREICEDDPRGTSIFVTFNLLVLWDV